MEKPRFPGRSRAIRLLSAFPIAALCASPFLFRAYSSPARVAPPITHEGSAGPDIGQTSTGRPTGNVVCLELCRLLATGATADDPRVRRAVGWLEEHYSLDAHPGMEVPRRGLYFYYHQFARAMTALGIDRIRDARGVEHDWRDELASRLRREQRPDGSWANPEESTIPEANSAPAITSHAILTLLLIQSRHPDRAGH